MGNEHKCLQNGHLLLTHRMANSSFCVTESTLRVFTRGMLGLRGTVEESCDAPLFAAGWPAPHQALAALMDSCSACGSYMITY